MPEINDGVVKTPGVYVTETDAFPPPVAQVDTAIPVFIGYTQKAFDPNANNLQADANGNNLTNIPTLITSLLNFEMYFGSPQQETGITVTITQTTDASNNILTETIVPSFTGLQSNHLMHPAIRFFYANGGSKCYVVSIGPYKANVGDALDPAKTEFAAGLEASKKQGDITLIVFPEGQKMVEADYYALQNSALDLCADINMQDRFCIIDVHDAGASVATGNDLTTVTTAFRGSINPTLPGALSYGAAYFPNLVTTFPYNYDATNTSITHKLNGAAGPLDGKKLSDLNDSTTGNIAMYNKVENALDNQFPMMMAPSAAVAGIYAKVDSSTGVWKAPANVGVIAITGPACIISDEMQENMNIDATSGKSINAIRSFTGKGTLVWGARTLLGNDNNWRYISVRRFYIMVEKSIKLAAFQFVFEANDSNTWVKMLAMMENYLTNLWRQGALAGSKPEQAFYVKVGLGLTMTLDDILNGKMIIEIGMAPLRPAEFIIIRITQMQQTS